jgi:NAD(P)-dependent dehydrogenase (short-subunit alcohol dehydrogenase family)
MSAALVTGASRGIGRGIALALAGAGYDVVVNYVRNEAAAQEVAALVGGLGTRAHLVRADISVAEDRRRLVDDAYGAVGQVDLLVNNAGVAPTVRSDILAATEESFDRVISIDLKGPYFLTQLIANRMIEQQVAGKIVTISSISAYAASPDRGDYCLAKAGLAMMTALYAARLAAHGITVFELRPGVIATDMTAPVQAKYDKLIDVDGILPVRRWGQPEDVGKAVAAIALDLLPYSTGQVIDIDGGYHLRTL